jgi:hypothetical protein
LDGLSEELRRKVLKFCTQKAWRISSEGIGTADPDFDEIRKFLLTEAQTSQKLTVYDKDRATRESMDSKHSEVYSTTTTTTTTITPTPMPTSVSTPIISTPATDAIAELTKQMSQLVLMIQAGFNS